jgi:Tol biopolymer transport system component
MGGKWGAGVEVSLPANGQDTGGAFLDSVSCASAGNCVAVGYYEAPSPIYDLTRGLLVSETAGVWAAGLEAPLPANAATDNTASEVDAVSCASSGDCTAVGTYYDNSDKLQGLLLTETAGSWTSSVEAALPTNAAGGLEPSYGFYGDSASPLSAVSCASPGNCTAVGHYPDSVGNVQGVLLSESGGTWATGVEAPLPADAAATPQGVNLTSVDCSSPGNCDAAGSYGVSAGGGAPLVLTETAGAWTTGVEPSLPANSSQATFFLNSISCAAAGTCSAVGGYWAPSSGQFGLLIGGTPSPPPLVTLTVSTSGPTGAGTVSDGSAEISCKTSCSYSYPAGTPITLTATPAAPSTFAGWSGCRDPASPTCAGSAEASICLTIDATRCTATLDGDAAITARFRSVAPRSKPCVVPKLRGKTLTGATRSIRAHACALGRITRVTSSAAPRNAEVIAQSPKPGTRLEHRGVIDLTVTMPVHCRVPETVGLSVRAAERKLRAADCRVGEIKHWTSPLRRENHVIGQDPARGRTRSAGTRISLVVGRGPRTGSLPSSGSILPGKLPPFIAYDPPAGGIWLLRPDGSDSHRVGPLYGSGPVWSPDGTRILYTAPAPQNDSLINYDLYVMNADGTDRRPLMPSGGGEGHGGWGYDDFHWSPDGKQIVFTQGEYLRGNVGIANADGSDEHPVPNTSDGGEASFSPDGSYIVFYGDGGYVGQVHHHGPDLAKSGIYVIKPDGSGLRQLTFGGGVEDPSWSPDGTRIIYSCLMDGSRQAHAICELSGNPTRQRILYRNSNDTFVDPRWNADGTKILVTLDRSVFGPDGIALMSPSGGPPVMLAPLSFPGDSSWNSAPYNGWNADW